MYPKYEEVVNARLVSSTKMEDSFAEEVFGPVGSPNLNEIIAYCGRVSNPKNQSNINTSDKLIQYLIKHKHWSPFEQVNVCIEVTSTRDIIRQLLRHRSFSFQEFSQRYADPLKENLGFCLRECRLQDSENRQNSLECTDEDVKRDWDEDQRILLEEIGKLYAYYLNKGMAKEQVRSILPEGNTVSRAYVNGSIRSWLHYLGVRTGAETQKEHRILAQKCAEELGKVFTL